MSSWINQKINFDMFDNTYGDLKSNVVSSVNFQTVITLYDNFDEIRNMIKSRNGFDSICTTDFPLNTVCKNIDYGFNNHNERLRDFDERRKAWALKNIVKM